MQPLIGVTNYYVDSNELGDLKSRSRGFTGQDMAMCTMDYVRGVEQAGGTPMMLCNITNDSYIDSIVEKCDGFLFSGGSDIGPNLYRQRLKENCGKIVPERDEFEMKLLAKAIKTGKPILGICRGMQLINIYYQGTLYQDLENYEEDVYHHTVLDFPKWYPVHNVRLEEDSHLAKAFEGLEVKTNSLHHQVIKDLGRGLEVSAKTSDGIIEGIEDKRKPFLVGVQWHPEMMFEKVQEQKKLFNYFIEQIKKK